jgi:hypothetical protein
MRRNSRYRVWNLRTTHLHIGYPSVRFPSYRPFYNCLVSALAKSRAANRLVRTMGRGGGKPKLAASFA